MNKKGAILWTIIESIIATTIVLSLFYGAWSYGNDEAPSQKQLAHEGALLIDLYESFNIEQSQTNIAFKYPRKITTPIVLKEDYFSVIYPLGEIKSYFAAKVKTSTINAPSLYFNKNGNSISISEKNQDLNYFTCGKEKTYANIELKVTPETQDAAVVLALFCRKDGTCILHEDSPAELKISIIPQEKAGVAVYFSKETQFAACTVANNLLERNPDMPIWMIQSDEETFTIESEEKSETLQQIGFALEAII